MRSSNSGGSGAREPVAAPLAEEDLDAVLEIERASFSRPWNREHFRFEIRDNPFAYNLVLRLDDEVLAYAIGWIQDAEVTVARTAVRASARRRGLGRRIVGLLVEEGRRRGCSIASLDVRETADAAIALYRSLGFHEVGRRRGYYELEDADALLMELDLGPAPRSSE